MLAIEILGFSKTYSTGFWGRTLKTALHPLNITVRQGEIFGFLGPNGAGKTTTLKLLLGLSAPSAGTARVLGCDFRDLSVRKKIGFLPEQPYFYDYLRAEELLDYYAALSGLSPNERKARVPALLARVGLAEASRQQLRKFSKGMLQRVGIAQALIHDPELLILDEPMSGLDPLGRHEVRELIQELNDQGKTIFFSTHILSDAEALCDRVAVIHKGQLRGVGVVGDFQSESSDQAEIVFQGAAALASGSRLVIQHHATGDTVRALIRNGDLDLFLEELRQSHARLVSVNPVQKTLEDYFLVHTSETQEAKK